MSTIGERDGIAVELLNHLDDLADEHEPVEEYREGEPPSFTIADVQSLPDVDNVFLLKTSTGEAYRVTVEVAS